MFKNFFSRFKEIIINAVIILIGVIVAVSVFALLQNIDQRKERETLLPRAEKAVESQEYSHAINLYLEAEKIHPEDINVKRSLADLYYLKNKYDEALSYYKALPEDQLNDVDYQKIGQIYYLKNDFDSTILYWKERTLDPKDAYKLAKIYYDRGEIDLYFDNLSKLYEYKEPLILSQYRITDLNIVIANAEKALTLPSITDEPLNVELFKTQITEAKKQSDIGKKEFSELLQISAFSNLNQCKLITDRITTLRKSLESGGKPTAQLDYYQGNCLNQLDKPDEAIPLLEKAIKSDSTILEYREALAKSHFLKGDVDKIKQVYAELLTIQKSSVFYQNLAVYLYKLDKKEDALTNYDTAFSLTQNDNEKKKIAKIILQINLREKNDLDVCNRSELSSLLKSDSYEDILILGHCALYLDESIDTLGSENSLAQQYILALSKKDRKEIDKVLDRDPDGMITTYFKSVGVKLLK